LAAWKQQRPGAARGGSYRRRHASLLCGRGKWGSRCRSLALLCPSRRWSRLAVSQHRQMCKL
jgi:hypothetical protein